MEFEEAAAAAETEAETVTEAPEVTPDLAETSQEIEQGEPSGDPTGQTFPVKIDGEVINVSLEEMQNGYQRQADYTRKTQELAQQREELSSAERILEALETDPERTLQALAAGFGVDFGQPQPQAATEPDEPVDPEEARFSRLESYIEAQEMRAFEAQVKSELADFREMFNVKFDDTEVLAYAAEHGIPSATEAAKAFFSDRIMNQARRQQADRQAQERKTAAPPVAGGHGVANGTTQTGGTVPPNDLEAALELALQSHGVSFD